MLKESYPLYLGNRPELPNTDLEVVDKYSGHTATRVPLADATTIDRAIEMAHAAKSHMAVLKPYARQQMLYACVTEFERRRDDLALSLCIEAGKPISDAEGEVTRLIDTFRVAAEEAVRIGGETIPLEISARADGYRGMTQRVPLGPCAFISPFNFPLNLVAHKVAPAIAAGCPFVLKPASATPVGALIIGEVLAGIGLPEGAFSILPCPRDGADQLVTDDRIKLLSFTGSDAVGWGLKAKAGKKKVVLELGGNAACIVDETADIDDAVARLVIGAFYQSGQSCISVQRILIHEKVYDQVREKLVAKVKALKAGDPKERGTFIGPMISEKEAVRLASWIEAAVAAGGRVLCGNAREGAMLSATLLEEVPADEKLCQEEAFGPVAVLSRFTDFEAALAEVNASRYGLQAGVFTRDLYRAQMAWDRLEVGGVVVGDIPSWRVDHMPYGGVKDSGIGREGLRYAIEEMTEIRLLVIRTPPTAK
ncbi:aldehyde dehydrogenase family protein [Desulfatitalea tepidiphila]|uniref:aldehyde dehydrogenase family protein n=1 Tax=Desulfatitalea tepidiphila TaxID=1185843 RepID=UPI0006B5035E|nr:aldehyde dehydrogenase family protein [Desulfatitalea tepidiphila]